MLLSYKWLSEYVKIQETPQKLAAALTLSGSKVETVTDLGADVINVVVGHVLDVSRHPQADKLFVCIVDVGSDQKLTIVTGADNVTPGAVVPVALDDSVLPCGKRIRKGKLRGVMSEGMLCSMGELNLTAHDEPGATEDGILLLDEPFEPGRDIREVLGFDDHVIEFEITNNRPDCLSVRGLARETAATLDTALSLSVPKVQENGPDIGEVLKVVVDAPELCARYSARVVDNVKIAPSPRWLRQRLRASGIRPINNIVDITNYVCLEYGQPMHAFDASCVAGGCIHVRRAQEGESIVTLDDQTRALTADMLLIADPEKAIGIAGVMGGAGSEITDTTQSVIFESANFFGPSVRKTALALGLRTEASGRFEKGLDRENTLPALDRACELVELLGCGEVRRGIIDVCRATEQPRTVTLEPERINAHLGTSIEEEFMHKALTALGFVLDGREITIPSWRADVSGMADISEEIARLYGYDRIPATVSADSAVSAGLTAGQKAGRKLSGLYRALGFSETMTYSFIGASDYEKACIPPEQRTSVKILNPLGEDKSLMRTSMLPSILDVLARNYQFRNARVKIAELGTTYHLTDEKLPREEQRLALGAFGDGFDFYACKGVVERILEAFLVQNICFTPQKAHPSFHPGRCAEVWAGETLLGLLGEVHPQVLENYEIGARAWAAELSFDALLRCAGDEARFVPLPRFPSVARDISLLCGKDVPAAALTDVIRKAAGAWLVTCEVFDVYTGTGVPEDQKSIAFSLAFRAGDRTLTDEEVDGKMRRVLAKLASECGAQLRGSGQ